MWLDKIQWLVCNSQFLHYFQALRRGLEWAQQTSACRWLIKKLRCVIYKEYGEFIRSIVHRNSEQNGLASLSFLSLWEILDVIYLGPNTWQTLQLDCCHILLCRTGSDWFQWSDRIRVSQLDFLEDLR